MFGLVVLASASAPLGYAKFQDAYWFIKRQALFGLLPGFLAFTVLSRVPYRTLARGSVLWYAGALLLLVLVFVPGLGTALHGSRSWLSIFGYYLQPVEFMKLALVIILASLLAAGRPRGPASNQRLIWSLAAIALPLIFILWQPDAGGALILAAVSLTILYLARVPARILAGLFLVGLAGLAGLVWTAPYRLQRFATFLHPERDPQGVGYQISQAFIAVGSGGWWGLGLGNSRQKFQYLPEVNADSIFAVVGEELGFIISALLVALITFLGWRGLTIAKHARDELGTLLAGGLTAWLVLQSYLNIGAMVGALPLTGVPLPFVSHGGTALLTALAAAGIIVNVSRYSRAA